MTAGVSVSDLAFRVQEALEGRGNLERAARELAEATRPDDEEQWNRAFDVQLTICRQIEMILDAVGEGKGDAWQLAMCFYVMEGLSERIRRYLHLVPPDEAEEADGEIAPAPCPTCGAEREWGAVVGMGRRLAMCEHCGNNTLDEVDN